MCNFISRAHTTSCSLPPCFVNTRATQLTMAASLLPTGGEKEIITYYFSRGYEYDAIVHFLAKFHNTTMSIRTLKNRLQRYQQRRRTPTYDLNLVREAILRELSGPGCSGGSRSMWHTLHLHNIQVPRHLATWPRRLRTKKVTCVAKTTILLSRTKPYMARGRVW